MAEIERFLEALAAENSHFFDDLHGGESTAAVRRAEDAGVVRILQARWFAELRAAEVIGRFVGRVPDTHLRALVARQVGDEGKHASLCQRRIHQLGGSVDDFVPLRAQVAYGDFLDTISYPEEFFAAQQFTVETESINRGHLFLSALDRDSAEMFITQIDPDEHQHSKLGHLGLRRFATDRLSQSRARDAAARVRDLQADIFRTVVGAAGSD